MKGFFVLEINFEKRLIYIVHHEMSISHLSLFVS